MKRITITAIVALFLAFCVLPEVSAQSRRPLQRTWTTYDNQKIQVTIEWSERPAGDTMYYDLKLTFRQPNGATGSLTLKRGFGTFGQNMTFLMPGIGFETTGVFFWWDKPNEFNSSVPLLVEINNNTLSFIMIENGWLRDVFAMPIELNGSFFR